jgi:hypothetical protein
MPITTDDVIKKFPELLPFIDPVCTVEYLNSTRPDTLPSNMYRNMMHRATYDNPEDKYLSDYKHNVQLLLSVLNNKPLPEELGNALLRTGQDFAADILLGYGGRGCPEKGASL